MKRSSILGALAVCALSLCAFGAIDASAAGLTAVTCEEVAVGTGNYKTSACETPKQAGSNFETKAIPLNQTTEVTGSAIGGVVLGGTVALVKVEITCAKTAGTAHLKNIEPKAGEMKIEGSKIFIDYSECHAALQANTVKKCEVESITGTAGVKGTIATTELKGLTTTEHNGTIEPAVGTTFAEFKILKTGECTIPTVTVKVTGSVNGVADTGKHSHITYTPATNGGGLKVNGIAGSFEGTTTGVMKGTTNLVAAETFP
jgi:hypothetical protein